MSLTVFPTVVFDASGSDTAASGAGPSTAISGSLANIAATSTTTVTINDAVNLSGVATDGSAVLWINTASGRQFSRISAISGSSGAWTLTVEDSTWTISTNVSWGIGGKLLTLNANNHNLLSISAKAGWTIQLNSDQSFSGCTLVAAGDTTNGALTIRGATDSPRPVITCTANQCFIFNSNGTNGRYIVENLKLQNSNVTKTSSCSAIRFSSQARVVVKNCVIGDATNHQFYGVDFGNGSCDLDMIDCEITSCVASAIHFGAGSNACQINLNGVKINDNATYGIDNTLVSNLSSVNVENSLIYANASGNIALSGGTVTTLIINNNVIDGSASGPGIDLGSVAHDRVSIYSNNITGNGTYGIIWTLAAADSLKVLIDYNCFGSGSAADGPANGSGPLFGITAGAHDQIGVSPNYIGRTSNPPNFTNATTSNVKAKGFPDSTRTIGGDTGGTTAYDDIGIQHQDAGGSSGISNKLIKTGNIGTY